MRPDEVFRATGRYREKGNLCSWSIRPVAAFCNCYSCAASEVQARSNWASVSNYEWSGGALQGGKPLVHPLAIQVPILANAVRFVEDLVPCLNDSSFGVMAQGVRAPLQELSLPSSAASQLSQNLQEAPDFRQPGGDAGAPALG